MLGAVAAEAARRFGDRTAYVSPDGSALTYGDLDRDSDAVALGLARSGVREGDVVAITFGAALAYPVAYLAAAKIGAITAGVNARLTAAERDRILDVTGPALVLTDAADVVALRDDHAGAGRPPPVAGDPDRPVAIVFTSGTTGTPKGAVFAGRQLEAITRVDTGGRWGEGGDQIAGTSFAHLAFMTKFPGKLVGGGITWMMERWSAGEALAMTARHRMTRIGGIPTQVALMLRRPDFDEHDLSSVRAIVVGGGPATPALVREARERFGAPVLVRYSCTEAGIGTGTAAGDPDEDAETTVGRAQPGVEVRIATDGGSTPPIAGEPGAVGEVCLRSAAVMSGYWNDPEATRAAFDADGFVHTGDMGWVDERGRLHLVGRAKEMYVRGGYNVFPLEIEAVLAAHPGVADVAVVPVADDVMGEIGVAVVVAGDPARPPSLSDLRRHGAGSLARHKLPERVVYLDALPLTAMDKVDRTALASVVQTSDSSSGN